MAVNLIYLTLMAGKYFFGRFSFGKVWKNMEKMLFFRVATYGLKIFFLPLSLFSLCSADPVYPHNRQNYVQSNVVCRN